MSAVTTTTGDIADPIVVGSMGSAMSGSFVKTDQNALLNTFSHSKSLTNLPKLLVRELVQICWGLGTCHNVLGLIESFSKSVCKKES